MNYKALAAAALTVAATGAWAQSDMGMKSHMDSNKLYLEAGYTMLNYEGGNVLEANPSVFRFIAGVDVVPNLAIEGMAAFSASDDTMSVNNVNTLARTKVDHAYGLYLKPYVMVNNDFEVFGRVGYLKAKFTTTDLPEAVSVSGTQSGASYGAGASYKLTKNVSLTGDYMVYLKKTIDSTTVKYDGVNVGLRYNF